MEKGYSKRTDSGVCELFWSREAKTDTADRLARQHKKTKVKPDVAEPFELR